MIPELQLATAHDVDGLVALRDDAARWLLERNIEQWRPGEFTRDRMRTWVEAGHVHVLRQNDHLVGCVAVLWEDKEVWGETGEVAGYIHLLVVHRDQRGSGLGEGVLAWAEQHIRDSGRLLSRLDAVSNNRALHNWYEQRGYAEVGHHAFPQGGWSPVILREKRLN